MIRTIRGRIAAFSFVVFLALVVLAGGLVLRGLERALERLADRDLRDELEAVLGEAADLRLANLAEGDAPSGTDWGDVVFELRDLLDARALEGGEAPLLYEIQRGTARVAASASLGGGGLPRAGIVREQGGVSFREERDPRPGADDQALRVAEVSLGPYRVELARSLAPLRRIQGAARTQVVSVLLGVSLLAALGAYWIAARALVPVRQVAREAERLRTLGSGMLPRSRRGDEIDELAAVLNRLLERVREEVERQRRFTADAAHEIRTPLASIRGHLELLLGDASPEAQQTLAGVLEEVERLTRLVNQLLLLEKLESGPQVARREPVDLGRLARDLVGHLAVLAEDQGISLVVRGDGPAWVEGDPERLRQILLNLLDNAFRHTPRGGEVTLELDAGRGRVRCLVRDTGPGVAPDQLERIFDRFASDRSRPQAGTGLGLPIARAIARAHGGELRAEPCTTGACFVVELPERSATG